MEIQVALKDGRNPGKGIKYSVFLYYRTVKLQLSGQLRAGEQTEESWLLVEM